MPRTALLARMLAAAEPVIAVAAPPGYGKTTLLAAWAERRGSRVAWVSCDQVDDDPEVPVVRGVVRTPPWEPLTDTPAESGTDPEDGDARRPPAQGMYAGPAESVARGPRPGGGAVQSRVPTLLAAFARSVPAGLDPRPGVPGAAAAPRGTAPGRAPTPRDRCRRPGDVTGAEATDLLARTGVELSRARTSELFWHTEGWPAALYLAALAVRKPARSPRDRPFTGTDRLMSDYLRLGGPGPPVADASGGSWSVRRSSTG